jgi:ABC-type Mn2+/Zn2+ transport system ATPase subunit
MPGKLLEVNNLELKRSGQEVFSQVKFDLEKAEYVSLIGENGSGKTSLVRTILGLEEGYTGDIKWFGDSNVVTGYVPQHSPADRYFPAKVSELLPKIPKDSDYTEIVTKALPVEHLQSKLFSNLSGGQKQLVQIYQALFPKPNVLFLDEPTSALDTGNQGAFYQLLKNLQTEFQISIVFITHDVESIAMDVDRILCLRRCHVEKARQGLVDLKDLEITNKLQHIHH